MTIFDTIRYPVDINITNSAYDSLPEGIKQEFDKRKEPLTKLIKELNGEIRNADRPIFIHLLRKVIAEWEDPQ